MTLTFGLDSTRVLPNDSSRRTVAEISLLLLERARPKEPRNGWLVPLSSARPPPGACVKDSAVLPKPTATGSSDQLMPCW